MSTAPVTMKAVVADEGLRVAEIPILQPSPGEALVRVRLAGICGTDLEVLRGYADFHGVLGHEFVGEVVQCQDASLLRQRVVGEINVSCGQCEDCSSSTARMCPNRHVVGIRKRDGVFAEYVTLPAGNLHRVPDKVTEEEAVFAEPLAAAFRVTEQVNLEAVGSALVLGDGRLGLLVAQVLKLVEVPARLLGRQDRKLAVAERLGLNIGSPENCRVGIADLVVDCTGSASGFRQALNLVRPGGTVVLKSTIASSEANALNEVTVKEITVIGSRCGPFVKALKALTGGQVEVRPLIDAMYPLADAAAAFEHASRPGALKVLLRP